MHLLKKDQRQAVSMSITIIASIRQMYIVVVMHHVTLQSIWIFLTIYHFTLFTYVYDKWAKNRYKWFGKTQYCQLPPKWLQRRMAHPIKPKL